MATYVRVGQILKPYGIKGECHCFSLTSFPKERFKKGNKLSLLNEKTGVREEVVVRSHKAEPNGLILSFEECNTPEEIGKYRNWFIEIDSEHAPLPKGYYRLEDLKGCEVIDAETGKTLGVVDDVTQYAPTMNIVVKKENGKRFYVPYVKGTFIKEADLENKRILINVMEGLL